MLSQNPGATRGHADWRARGLLAAAVTLVLLSAGCTDSQRVDLVTDEEPGPQLEEADPSSTRMVTGAVRIDGPYVGEPGATCDGGSAYPDLAAGRTVVLHGADGAVLGRGRLSTGELVDGPAGHAPSCRLTWQVGDVPVEGGPFSIEIAGQYAAGPWDASQLDELTWSVEVVLALPSLVALGEPTPLDQPGDEPGADEATGEGTEAPSAVPPPTPEGSPTAAPEASPTPIPRRSPTPSPSPSPSPPPPPPPPPPSPSPTPTTPATRPVFTSIESVACSYDAGTDQVTLTYTLVFSNTTGWALQPGDNRYANDGRRQGELTRGFDDPQGTRWRMTFFTASAYWNDVYPPRGHVTVTASSSGEKARVSVPQTRLEFSTCAGWPS